MKRAIASWVAVVLFGALPSPSFTADIFHLDVAAAKAGKSPAGWSIATTGEGPGGVWGVVEDATTPGGKALAQTSDQGITTAAPSPQQSNGDQLPSASPGQTWKLVWQDEFDGDQLDTTKWTPRPDGKRKGGWWSPKAIGLDGKSNLVIKTFMDGDKPTDGCITTQGKFEHSYGYYVARIQLQSQPGHWSAFWITGPGVGKVGDDARDGCEIDIMEKPWLDERVQHTFHWDGYGQDHKSEGHVAKVPGVMHGFHTFGLWWKADEYIFYVDGKETWRSKAGGVCQVPQYMLLSDEIGNWAGDIAKAKLPDQFLVDYVRVYDVVEKK